MFELSNEALERARKIEYEIRESFYGPDSLSDGAGSWETAKIIAVLEERILILENSLINHLANHHD